MLFLRLLTAPPFASIPTRLSVRMMLAILPPVLLSASPLSRVRSRVPTTHFAAIVPTCTSALMRRTQLFFPLVVLLSMQHGWALSPAQIVFPPPALRARRLTPQGLSASGGELGAHNSAGLVSSSRTGSPSRSRTTVLNTGGVMKKSARRVSYVSEPTRYSDAPGETQLRAYAWPSQLRLRLPA